MASNSGPGGPTAKFFPTQAQMASAGLDPGDYELVYNLQRLRLSSRAVKELAADAAAAPAQVKECAVLGAADLEELIMLAQVAEEALGTESAGGRRRRHRKQRGGALSDAVKGVLRSLCGMFRRGLEYNERQATSAIENLGQALDSVTDEESAARMNGVLRNLLLGGATTTAVYDLARGPDGWIGSIVVAITTALYNASPDPATAATSVLGAGQVAALGAAGVAGAYIGTAAVTYASAIIRRGVKRLFDAAREIPNPTNPEHVHRAIVGTLQAFPQVAGALRHGGPAPFLPPPGSGAGAAASAGRGPGARFSATLVIPALADVSREVAVAVAETQRSLLAASDADVAAEFSLPADRVRALRQRNAQRFGGPGGGAAAASASSSGGTGEMEEDGGGAGGMGGRGRRRKTRKHSRRGGRRHTRKH
jgi:hypothetical protein